MSSPGPILASASLTSTGSTGEGTETGYAESTAWPPTSCATGTGGTTTLFLEVQPPTTGLLLMDMLQHTLISICPASDHLLVSLPRGWERAAWTRGMRRKKTQDVVFCVNLQAAKLHGNDRSLR